MMLAVNAVILAASELTDYSREDIIGRRRHQGLARVRHAVAAVSRRENKGALSYPMIAWRLGKRDHSTIMSSIRAAEDLEKRDPTYADFMARLCHRAREIGGDYILRI